MNTINFLEKPNFPLSSDVLDFMQKAYLLLQKFAGFGGNRYILAGCTETGNSVSDGYIVIDGEVMPFTGGTKQSQIIVVTESKNITAFGETYQGYTSRYARFGTGSPMYSWADFQRINNLQELLGKFSQIQWSQINNKPIVFPPADHNQDWNTITGKPATFPPADHRQDWSTLDNVPGTFPPTPHNQGWETVTGKPLTYPPSNHNQDWSTITGKPDKYNPEIKFFARISSTGVVTYSTAYDTSCERLSVGVYKLTSNFLRSYDPSYFPTVITCIAFAAYGGIMSWSSVGSITIRTQDDASPNDCSFMITVFPIV